MNARSSLRRTTRLATKPPAAVPPTPRRVTQSKASQRPWTPPAAPQAHRSWARRHWAISSVALIFIAPFLVAAMIGMVKGISGSVSGPGVINIVHTNSYDDCLTLANKDNFASDVCEGLDPNSQVAKVNCAYEQLHKEPLVDCPTATPKATTSSSSSQVSNFNDGFSTAKQDDCQQGDTKACTWLQTTNH